MFFYYQRTAKGYHKKYAKNTAGKCQNKTTDRCRHGETPDGEGEAPVAAQCGGRDDLREVQREEVRRAQVAAGCRPMEEGKARCIRLVAADPMRTHGAQRRRGDDGNGSGNDEGPADGLGEQCPAPRGG